MRRAPLAKPLVIANRLEHKANTMMWMTTAYVAYAFFFVVCGPRGKLPISFCGVRVACGLTITAVSAAALPRMSDLAVSMVALLLDLAGPG